MSNPEQLLTRINLASVDLKGVPGGSPTLTRNDIVAALGMGRLPDKCYLLARAYYLEDYSVLSSLAKWVWTESCVLARKEGWHKQPGYVRGQELIRRVALVALEELLTRHQHRCRCCGGGGERPPGVAASKDRDLAPGTCPRCRGTGYRRHSELSRSLKAGIPNTTWRSTWMARHERIYCELVSWLVRVDRHIHDQMREPAEP